MVLTFGCVWLLWLPRVVSLRLLGKGPLRILVLGSKAKNFFLGQVLLHLAHS